MTPRFYGWPLVFVGFLLYGLGMAPAYYSWGFFAPEVIRELGLSRQQIGEIFGAFTLGFAGVSSLTGALVGRFGLRATITFGSFVAAAGWWWVSMAQSVTELYLSYSLVGGVGIGLSTLLPAQTLPVYWFRKYRARATAVILLGAAVFGAIVNPIDALILEHYDWRTAWRIIAGTSIFVGLLALVFVRNKPEDVGQLPDGVDAEATPATVPSQRGADADGQALPVPARAQWRPAQAIWTAQFVIITLAAMANSVPWRVLTAHARLHFENLGFTPALAAAVLGVRVGMSGLGRLSGSFGDFLPPNRVLGLALIVNGLGISGLIFATRPTLAYACVALLGVGYGAAFTSVPVVFANFFGREAFMATSGLRLAIVGVVGFIGPSWAGAAADRSGSYTSTLVVLAALCFCGSVAISLCRAPEHPEQA
ncbi:MAG: MFS transporter [Acidobacteriota bacterium]